MNRKDFVETYIDTKDIIDMLDKSDRNIYNFLKMFSQIYTDRFHFTLNYNVKDYDEKELEDYIVKLINKAENLFYINKLDSIYRECLDIYGDEISINKFTVRYFEKRNTFIDKIIDNMIKSQEKEDDTITENNNNEL